MVQFPRGVSVRHHCSIFMLSIPLCLWLAEVGTGLTAERKVSSCFSQNCPFKPRSGLGKELSVGLCLIHGLKWSFQPGELETGFLCLDILPKPDMS